MFKSLRELQLTEQISRACVFGTSVMEFLVKIGLIFISIRGWASFQKSQVYCVDLPRENFRPVLDVQFSWWPWQFGSSGRICAYYQQSFSEYQMLILGVLALCFSDGLPLCRGWGNPLFHFRSAQKRGFHLTGMASSMKVVAIASGCILCSHRVRESRNIIYSANTFKVCSKSCQLQKTKVAIRFYPEKYRSIYRNILELRYKSKKLQLVNLKPLQLALYTFILNYGEWLRMEEWPY